MLEIKHEPIPTPEAGMVRVRIDMIGINRGEAQFREGTYVVPTNPPSGVGYEAVGRVTAVGEGVENVVEGKFVAVLPAFDPNDFSTYAEEPCFPAHAVVPLPDDLPLEAGASLVSYLTAWGGLVHLGGLAEGEYVLVNAAASSVGVASIQIVRDLGGRAIAVTRTTAKRDALLDAGAETVIIADGPFTPQVMEATEDAGADLIFDPVIGETFEDTADAAAKNGRIVIYGVLGGWTASLPIMQVIAKGLSIKGLFLVEMMGTPAFESAMSYLLPRLRSGALSPIVDRTFQMDDVRKVHEYVESNQQIGKILMTP